MVDGFLQGGGAFCSEIRISGVVPSGNPKGFGAPGISGRIGEGAGQTDPPVGDAPAASTGLTEVRCRMEETCNLDSLTFGDEHGHLRCWVSYTPLLLLSVGQPSQQFSWWCTSFSRCAKARHRSDQGLPRWEISGAA